MLDGMRASAGTNLDVPALVVMIIFDWFLRRFPVLYESSWFYLLGLLIALSVCHMAFTALRDYWKDYREIRQRKD